MAEVPGRRPMFGSQKRGTLVGVAVVVLVLAGVGVAGRWVPLPTWWTLRGTVGDLGSTDSARADRGYETLRAAGRDAIPRLLAAARDANPGVRLRAFRLLARLRLTADEALPTLLAGLDDPDRAVRLLAIPSVKDLGSAARAAAGRLGELTRDADSAIRVASALAIERVAPDSAAITRPVFLAAMLDRDPAVAPGRAFFADKLRDQGPAARDEAVAGLVAMLAAPDRRSRRQAVDCLVVFGPAARAAVPALTAALLDADVVVRCRAVAALEDIENVDAARARRVLAGLRDQALLPTRDRNPVQRFLESSPTDDSDHLRSLGLLNAVATDLLKEEQP